MTFIRATCRKVEQLPYAEATEEQVAAAPKDRDGMPGQCMAKVGRVIPITCDFETADAAAYEQHIRDVHGLKLRRGGWASNGQPMLGQLYSLPQIPPKPWRAPRPSKELYDPKPWEVGSTVSWSEVADAGRTYFDEELGRVVGVRETVQRTGQVWSLASGGGVWVVDEDQAVYEIKPPKRPHDVPTVYSRQPGPAEQAEAEAKKAAEKASKPRCWWPECPALVTHNVVSGAPLADHLTTCAQHAHEVADKHPGTWPVRRSA